MLAVAIGEATKTITAVMNGSKQYCFTVTFGSSTTTDDAEGDVLASTSRRPTNQQIQTALQRFRGDIMQIPPVFSAIKVSGKRAHSLAREGREVTLQARPLHVAKLEMLDRPDPDHARFEMICGKGGYVRSIARDLGTDLGCLGHVRELRRLRTGPFTINDCISLDSLRIIEPNELPSLLLPVEAALTDLKEYRCTAGERERILNGNVIPLDQGLSDGEANCWVSYNAKAIALAECGDGRLRPRRIIHQSWESDP